MNKFALLSILICFPFTLHAYERHFRAFESVDLTLYKENYILPYTRVYPEARDAKHKTEVQYQFSFRLALLGERHSILNFAYTQKAFWQVYDTGNSRPFREVNHNPEFFLRFGGRNFIVDTGYEHESNGLKDPESRSWDRYYIRLKYLARNFKISFKHWWLISEDKFGAAYPERKESLLDYYGNSQLKFAIRFGPIIFKNTARYNTATHNGFIETQLMHRLSNKLYLTTMYTRGYGLNLRDYNLDLETYGIGFLINP